MHTFTEYYFKLSKNDLFLRLLLDSINISSIFQTLNLQFETLHLSCTIKTQSLIYQLASIPIFIIFLTLLFAKIASMRFSLKDKL